MVEMLNAYICDTFGKKANVLWIGWTGLDPTQKASQRPMQHRGAISGLGWDGLGWVRMDLLALVSIEQEGTYRHASLNLPFRCLDRLAAYKRRVKYFVSINI